MRLAAAAVLLAIHPCAGTAHAQGAPDPRAARVDSLFAALNRTPSPGLALAVVRDGRVVLRRGYGLADVEHRVPITPSTVFDIASLSKQFTGLVVAELVAEGKVRLSDDIRRYIPELRLGRPVTVEQLLHHTSGVRDWPATLAVAGRDMGDTISFGQILGMAYGQRSLNFEPGAEYVYSNTGYNLLAEMVQRVTGRSFRAVTDERIFRPLGMRDTHVRDDLAEAIPNRALGYARTADGSWRATPNNLTALGSSSTFSSVDDMARWLIDFDRAAVGGAALSLMRTKGRLNDGTPVPYAFGIEHGVYRGLPMVTHSGSWASFNSYLAHLPLQKLGIVVLANGGSAINAQDAVIKVANIYLESDLPPPAPSRAAAPATAPAAVTVPPAVLDQYAGLYHLGPGWYTRIRRQGAALTSQATGEVAAPMTPRSEREFWVELYRAAMVFQRDGRGRVTHLDYHGLHAPKLPETSPPPPARLAEYAGEYESRELGATWRVSVKDGALEMWHPRQGTLPLTWFWRDDFGSPGSVLSSVEFQRDAAGRVTGFVVNVDTRTRDIRFVKRR
jgi:CubicO group peptidase (beta-lactamase class C family)